MSRVNSSGIKRKAERISQAHEIQTSKASLQGLLGELIEDAYEDSTLQKYHPSTTKENFALYILPMARVPDDIRTNVEQFLHLAWKPDKKCTENISRLLCLTTYMKLRSGKTTARPSCSSEASVNDMWLILEVQKSEYDSEHLIVGALLLRRQVGGLVIEYVTALRSHGGKGFPMVQAAEVICKKEGFAVLWSAVDLAQNGQHFAVLSADEAHQRWGFQPSTAKEWQDMGLEIYDEAECSVRYMKKMLLHLKKTSTSTGRVVPLVKALKGVQVKKVRGQFVATSEQKRP